MPMPARPDMQPAPPGIYVDCSGYSPSTESSLCRAQFASTNMLNKFQAVMTTRQLIMTKFYCFILTSNFYADIRIIYLCKFCRIISNGKSVYPFLQCLEGRSAGPRQLSRPAHTVRQGDNHEIAALLNASPCEFELNATKPVKLTCVKDQTLLPGVFQTMH